MTVENYPKCRTCRHCKLWDNSPGVGECTLVDNNSDPAWLPSGVIGDNQIRMMADKFGCILHEQVITPSP
jgi:hypothetical protein